MRVIVSIVCSLIVFAGFGTAAAQDASPTDCVQTSEEENAVLVMRWYDEALNQQNLEVLDEILADGHTHDSSRVAVTTDLEATRENFRVILGAHPDLHITVSQLLTEGNKVAAHWTIEATFENDFREYPATGEQVAFDGINFFHFDCGRIAHTWSVVDRLTQFGLVEPAEATPVATEATPADTSAPCGTTTEEGNLDLAVQWMDAWSSQDLSEIEELVSPGIVRHWGHGVDTIGVAALQERMGTFFEAFPELSFTIEDTVVEADLVAIRWTATVTHSGTFLGLEPTGETATFSGVNIIRIECGQVAEDWNESDILGLIEQLQQPGGGATPAA
jgi:steroid delta-isomerase-like uncharacterized protein